MLIDLIYEAAVIPERWPAVLDHLAGETGAAFGSLLTERDGALNIVGTRNGDHIIQEYMSLSMPPPNTRWLRREIAVEKGGFITDHDLFTPAEMDADPFYAEFMRPRGYGWLAGTVLDLPTGDVIALSVERRLEVGPFQHNEVDYLNSIRPHLARAAFLSARLALEKAATTANLFQAVGLPAAVLKAGGRLYSANDLFQALIPSAFLDRRDRLQLVGAAADQLFKTAFQQVLTGPFERIIASIPVPVSAGSHPPLVVHLIPIRREARDIFQEAVALVVVNPVEEGTTPSPDIIQALFDLSPAESRAVRAFAAHKTYEGAARTLNLSKETIRSQIKAVYSKTGLSGQAELLALVNRIGALPGSPE